MPVADDVELGEGVVIYHPELVNLYGCSIGRDTTIAPFVEIGRGVRVGSRCKISTHSYVCAGVTIEDEVFIGHGVMFVNDLDPPAALEGRRVSMADRPLLPILIRRNASIGSGVVILGGVTIGTEALVGAGAVVTRDVADRSVVAGIPARVLRQRS